MNRKTFLEIDSEAKQMLPDAKCYPEDTITIKVGDNVGGTVNVTFKKYADDEPHGWQSTETDYF